MVRLNHGGKVSSLSDFRAGLAGAIVGHRVELSAARAVPGRSYVWLYVAADVEVEEEMDPQGGGGNPRDGSDWYLRWTFRGTGARAGALAEIEAIRPEPQLDDFTVRVTEPDADAMRQALGALSRGSS
jgi:hypothetical protein